jgi:hypothetical protein
MKGKALLVGLFSLIIIAVSVSGLMAAENAVSPGFADEVMKTLVGASYKGNWESTESGSSSSAPRARLKAVGWSAEGLQIQYQIVSPGWGMSAGEPVSYTAKVSQEKDKVRFAWPGKRGEIYFYVPISLGGKKPARIKLQISDSKCEMELEK